MKVIDMSQMEMVFAGEPWTHKLMPCSKQAIPLLERNEKIVSWIRPKGGDVTQHIPAIRYKDKFFTLSLRMQKAIYRHIRLKKGFKNEEIMDGVVKLRIPDVLLKEKIRTQSRFDAMRKGLKAPTSYNNKLLLGSIPIPTTTTSSGIAIDSISNGGSQHQNVIPTTTTTTNKTQMIGQKDRIKNTCTVSARMRQVVEQMLACDPEQYALAMQETTIFAFKSQQSELILSFLQEMRRENCHVYQNKEALLQIISEAYDKTQTLFFAI